MKVQITKEAKKWLTAAEMPIAKALVSDFKDDISTVADIARDAAELVSGFSESIKVYKATAEIAHNDRVFNYYSDNSAHLDVWIQFTAFNADYGLLVGGVYLSDMLDENYGFIVSDVYPSDM